MILVCVNTPSCTIALRVQTASPSYSYQMVVLHTGSLFDILNMLHD